MMRVLLVDDQLSVRRGLRMLLELEGDLTVVGEVADGCSALDLAAALAPDVVVLDLEMPGMDGLATATALRANAPGVAIIFLSIHDEMAARARAVALGASAFVKKAAGLEPLIEAIRRAAPESQRPADD